MAERDYSVYASNGSGSGQTIVRILDGATPYLAEMSRKFPAIMDRAIRHGGWWLQGTIKTEFAGGRYFKGKGASSPGWSRYHVLDFYRGKNNRRGVGKFSHFGAKNRRKRGTIYNVGHWNPIGGNLIHAVGYSHKKQMQVQIGWLSASSAKLGYQFQKGGTTKVTRKTRGLFAAAGILQPKGDTLRQPARPVFDPAFSLHRSELCQIIEARFAAKLREAAFKKSGIPVYKPEKQA
jgi:hypothetical protein